MNLDIIITHYKEPWETGKQMFDMLAMQRDINFDDFGVIIVNDGEENALPVECFIDYPYDICQMSIPHKGVSAARNAGLDASDADWVMFCDFDDSFSSIFGLHLIFCAMHDEQQYDTIWSCFTEETKDNEGKIRLVGHDRDYVFIHGKAHRRQFLVDNNLRFNEKLTIHEDVFFTMLTQTVAKPEKIGGIKSPFYLWKWNDASVVRKDNFDDYILHSYDHLIRQRIALTEEFLKRGMADSAMVTIIKTVVDCYYDCQQCTWRIPKNKEALHKVENWFAAYLKRYAKYYAEADIKMISSIAKASRDNSLKKGAFFMEAETLSTWLNHIMDTAKPIPVRDQGI